MALSSSETTEATVPFTVTIPVGQSAASFSIDAVDDAIVDGTQVVFITASAIGYVPGVSQLGVTDDDDIDLNSAPEIISITGTIKAMPGQEISLTAQFTDEDGV